MISYTTVQRLTRSEKATEEWKAIISDYDTKISKKLDVKNSDLTKHCGYHKDVMMVMNKICGTIAPLSYRNILRVVN